jgi:hypothetical protein
LHTLDSATALLNSPHVFPSRCVPLPLLVNNFHLTFYLFSSLQIPQTSHRHFSPLARRLGRIFAHAYFHHRETFERAEAESSLYARFLALATKFELVPQRFLIIPPTRVIREGRESGKEREAGGAAAGGEEPLELEAVATMDSKDSEEGVAPPVPVVEADITFSSQPVAEAEAETETSALAVEVSLGPVRNWGQGAFASSQVEAVPPSAPLAIGASEAGTAPAGEAL